MAEFFTKLLLKMPIVGRLFQTSIPELPLEMQEEIMIRLDPQTAAMSRCVSRSWRTYLEDLSSRNLFIIWTREGFPLSTFALSRFEGKSFHTLKDLGQIEKGGRPVASVGGLLLLKITNFNYNLFNPFTGDVRDISYNFSQEAGQAFGLLRESDDVKIYITSRATIRVYSVLNDEWSAKKPARTWPRRRPGIWLFSEGNFYWNPDDFSTTLDYWDMKREGGYRSIELPKIKNHRTVATTISGRLCAYSMSQDRDLLDLWMLRKENMSWEHVIFSKRLPKLIKKPVCLIGCDIIFSCYGQSPFVYRRYLNQFEALDQTVIDINHCQIFPVRDSLFFPVKKWFINANYTFLVWFLIYVDTLYCFALLLNVYVLCSMLWFIVEPQNWYLCMLISVYVERIVLPYCWYFVYIIFLSFFFFPPEQGI